MGFSINEAVLASGLGRDMIYGAIRDGRLKARKVGRRTLILRADLEAYLSSLQSSNSASCQVAGAVPAAVRPGPTSEAGGRRPGHNLRRNTREAASREKGRAANDYPARRS